MVNKGSWIIGWFKELLDGAPSEEVELEELGQLLETDAEAAKVLEVAEQKVSDQGYVNLGHDGVFGVADEGFDLQVLFDEAEEGLDLPAFLVDSFLPIRSNYLTGVDIWRKWGLSLVCLC